MNTRYIFAVLLTFIITCQLIGQVDTDSVRLHQWSEFKQLHGEDWNIRWNEYTGIPAAIYSGRTIQYHGTPAEIAGTFLTQNRELFQFQPGLNDLKKVRIHEREVHDKTRIYHLKKQQYYKDLRVENAELLVHILSDGTIDMVNGSYYPHIDIPVEPSIHSDEAYSIAVRDLGEDVVLFDDPTEELVVLPREGDFYLSWKIFIPAEQPFGEWIFFIDALTGEILEKRNEICFVTGNGNVYPTHPGLSSVTNVPLYALDGTGYLEGLYADVRNWDGTRAYSANHSFNYSPSDKRFDEMNVYYQIHDYRGNYLQQNLGFNNFTQIRAYVNIPVDNAWYSPSTGHINFGTGPGSGFNNFAHEDKVIHHEYTHAMNHSIVSLNYGANESGAIEEGLADYFPASHTDRKVILEYAAPHLQRDLSNPQITHYTEYEANEPVQQHQGGEFLSATLWDMRTEIGAIKSDPLIYGSIYRLTSNATFLSFREAVITEDQTFYGGSDVDDIKNVFANRGIGDPPTPPPPTVSISGPSGMMEGQSAEFTANVSGGTPPYSYQWYYRHFYDGGWTSASGWSTYYHTAGSQPGEYLRVVVTDANQGSNEAQHTITILGMNSHLAGDSVVEIFIPENYSIGRNYPNPFNPMTTIQFGLPEPSYVTLIIYDMTGREVRRLVDGSVEPGYHTATWDSRNEAGNLVSSGVYLYRFTATPAVNESEFTGITESNTMLLVK